MNDEIKTTRAELRASHRKLMETLKRHDASLRKIEASGFSEVLTDESREQIEKLGANFARMREQMVEYGDEFKSEIREIDAQVDRIISLTQEPLDRQVEQNGAGKVRVLNERRVARDPHTQIRDFPLADKIGKELNAEARELAQGMFGQPLGKVVERLMDEAYPEMMKAFYPRIYENTGRYPSPRACAAALCNMIAETLRYGYDRTATAYRLAMPGLGYLRQRRVPMFFLAPDLMEAVERTDFDDDIDWTTLSLPYETGLLVLPKGRLVHPEDGEVAMLMWSRIRQGEHAPPWPGIPKSILPWDAFVILGLCMDKCIWYDSILTANVRKVLRLNNLFYRAPGEAAPSIIRSNYMDDDLTEQDAGFVEKMGCILFGTIMAMNARPLLVEHGKLLKRVGQGEKVREFWSPNVIGARYKFKREVARIEDRRFVTGPHEHGTHASPRMHWRRGHYRNQPYGPGRKEHKSIWIEPCLIGAEA